MKRIIGLLLALLLVLSTVALAACNATSSDTDDSDSEKTATVDETSPAVSATQAPKATIDPTELEKLYDKIKDKIEPYKVGLGKLLDVLLAYLDLDQMHGQVTQEDDDSVAMDATILFANDSYELTEDGKSDLRVFMDAYVQAVFTEENKDAIKAIVVEGHTDTNGTHEYNQTLSENRAKAVMNYCVELHPEVKEYMTYKGYSYDRPILNDDGTVNMEKSRRVVFSIEGEDKK